MTVLDGVLEPVLESLPFREREIVRLRAAIGGWKYTRHEVARIFNVTGERIRQVESKALRKAIHPARRIPTLAVLALEEALAI